MKTKETNKQTLENVFFNVVDSSNVLREDIIYKLWCT